MLETNVGLGRNVALVTSGCLNLAFGFGSLLPSLGLDKIGRRMPMMIGCFVMGVSMLIIAVLLSRQESGDALPTSRASIAFFVIVS